MIEFVEDKPYYSTPNDLYQYRVYPRGFEVHISSMCSYWYLNEHEVGVFSGSDSRVQVFTDFLVCVEIVGYTPERRTSSYAKGADLPYINGCATKQLIPPNRLGDPTWQYLSIPPGSQEQQQHIHSTARVVYIAAGNGSAIVGMPAVETVYHLMPGMVMILPKMIPHHFIAGPNGLVVMPLHVFSSTSLENNHPMFAGTHLA